MPARMILALDCNQPCDRCDVSGDDLYAMRQGRSSTLVCADCRELMQGEWADA
jgi:hypothetical protein